MKHFIFNFFALIFASFSFAQTPQGVSYQAIAFNAGGAPVVNSNVGVKISLLDNSANGNLIYSETHTKTTNAQGLFNLNIGQGSPTNGLFSSINWANNSKFLKVEIDPTGGTNYTIVGSNQLMSVPYALYAENTNTDNIQSITTSTSTKSGTMIVVYTSTNAYGFTRNSSGTPTWYSNTLSGTVLGAIALDSSIVIYTTTNVYGFTLNTSGTPTWYSFAISGTPISALGNNDKIVVYTSTNAYGFTRNSSANPTWYSNTLSGTPLGATISGEYLVIYTSTNAYGFTRNSSSTPTWYSNVLSGTPIDVVPK